MKNENDMGHTLVLVYQVPTSLGNLSEPRMFKTRDGKEWRRAIDAAHENDYKVLKAYAED